MSVERAVLPSEGLIARTAPNAAEESSNRLRGLRPVTVLERRGAWAKVETENGSVGWVDGRRLLGDGRSERSPGGGPLKWGLWLGVIGLAGVIIGYAIQGDADTKSGLLGGGLMVGFGGWLIIAALILVIVGLVRRSRTR
jgi:hypothetical protein